MRPTSDEQRERDASGNSRPRSMNAPSKMTDSATRISAPGTVAPCRCSATPAIIATHEADRERGAGAVRGGEAADRHHGGEMIEADDRMAEPGQSPSLKVAGMRPPIT